MARGEKRTEFITISEMQLYLACRDAAINLPCRCDTEEDCHKCRCQFAVEIAETIGFDEYTTLKAIPIPILGEPALAP